MLASKDMSIEDDALKEKIWWRLDGAKAGGPGIVLKSYTMAL